MNASPKHLLPCAAAALLLALAPSASAQDDGPFTLFEDTTEKDQAADLADAASASKQTTAALKDEEAGYIRYFGNKKYRGSLRLYGKVAIKGNKNSAEGHQEEAWNEANPDHQIENKKSAFSPSLVAGAVVDVDIQGFGLEAARVEYDFATGKDDSPWMVKIAGYTIKVEEKKKTEEQQKADEKAQKDKLGSSAPRKLLPKDYHVNVYLGFPIVLSGNFGVGLEAEMIPMVDVIAPSFSLQAKVNPYLYGWVACGVGYGGFPISASAGIKADLRLLDAEGNLKIGVTSEHAVGDLELKLTALKLKLGLYAKLKVYYWTFWGWNSYSKSWSKTLYSFSAGVLEHKMHLFGPEA